MASRLSIFWNKEVARADLGMGQKKGYKLREFKGCAADAYST